MMVKTRRMKLSATAKRMVPDLLRAAAHGLMEWEADKLEEVAVKIEECTDKAIGFTFDELTVMDPAIRWCAELDPAGKEDAAIGTFARDVCRARVACCVPGTYKPLPQYAGECQPKIINTEV